MTEHHDMQQFVSWFRHAAPYIHAFRNRTFVIVLDGSVLTPQQLPTLTHDIALLHSLGIRLVLVHGARMQIEAKLAAKDIKTDYIDGLRVTDQAALACVIEATGSLRITIEAMLSMGLPNSPMGGAKIRVASSNVVTAKPLGVKNGIDFLHTGKVRRIDEAAIEHLLDEQTIVLLSPIGYSSTGEVFNLSVMDVAAATAQALNADKLICLSNEAIAGLPRQLTLDETQALLDSNKLSAPLRDILAHALSACRHGVCRAHLINQQRDGALLLELLSRDGIGTMINADLYEGTRPATVEDIGGILELLTPLENSGVLVRRSREKIEADLNDFIITERDGTIIACAALHIFDGSDASESVDQLIGELACVVVHPDYRHGGYGNSLIEHIHQQAKQQSLKQLFVLTTEASHWFQEHGFKPAELSDLPIKKQRMLNYQRNSKVLIKVL